MVVGLCFAPCQRLNLEGFSNPDWASNVDDRRSTSSNCVFLGNNLLTWSSRNQKVVARSSIEAEYKSLSTAASELLWFQSLFKELGIVLEGPAVLWCDNMGVNSLASNPFFYARTKHIEIDVHFV